MIINRMIIDKVSGQMQVLGFKKSKNYYYRVLKDMLQLFEIENKTGPECVVNFGLVPVAMGIQHLGFQGFYLLNLSDGNSYSGWTYDFKSKNSYERCTDEIAKSMEKDLFPFFERASNSQNALRELVSLEQQQHSVHMNFLKRHHGDIPGGDLLKTRPADPCKLWFALDCYDFRSARICYEALIGASVAGFMSVKNILPQDKLEERKQEIEKYAKEVELLNQGKYEYFDQIIEQNRAVSLKFLDSLK